MSEWKEYKLGEIAVLNYGKALAENKRISGNVPVYSSAGITGWHNEPLVNSEGLIIGRKGTIGKVYYSNTPFFCIDTAYYILPNEKIYDLKFLFYKLKTVGFEDLNEDSAVPGLNRETAYNQEVLLPQLPEQKAIASVLSSLDNKIDLLHRQNSTLEKMAETLFRQWFIEEAKEEWECYKLKDLVKHVKPGTNFQPKRIEYGIPFLNVRNLNNGFIDLSDTTKISKEEYQRVHKNWEPEENDILISRIGTLGIVAVIQGSDLPVAVHYNMINLKAKTISYQFLYFLLKSQLFKEKYFSNVRQSVQEYVTIEDTENVEISLPIGTDLFKEHEIAFNELFNKIKSNQTQIRTLTALRDTLLPKLMSGEIRVL